MRKTPLPAILLSTVLLASCGGSSSSGPTTTTPAADLLTATAAATLGDCFTWTPGIKYTRTDGRQTLIAQEQFEGQAAMGQVELRADGTRFGSTYFTVDSTYVQVLGGNQYDSTGVYDGKDVNSSGNRLPVNMTPGQSVQLSYTRASTRSLAPSTTTNEAAQVTFVGFESLTLGGRTFTNVCRVDSPDPSSAETHVSWVAPGFGFIRSETQDAQGVTVPGTRGELAAIDTVP